MLYQNKEVKRYFPDEFSWMVESNSTENTSREIFDDCFPRSILSSVSLQLYSNWQNYLKSCNFDDMNLLLFDSKYPYNFLLARSHNHQLFASKSFQTILKRLS